MSAAVTAVQPDPDCYGCLGTGRIVGFGMTGAPCRCVPVCQSCGRAFTYEHDGEPAPAECGACAVEDEPTDPIVRKARVSSMRMLRIYVAGARGQLPDNGQSVALKWLLVWAAAERFLTWKESR